MTELNTTDDGMLGTPSEDGMNGVTPEPATETAEAAPDENEMKRQAEELKKVQRAMGIGWWRREDRVRTGKQLATQRMLLRMDKRPEFAEGDVIRMTDREYRYSKKGMTLIRKLSREEQATS